MAYMLDLRVAIFYDISFSVLFHKYRKVNITLEISLVF